MKKKKNIFSSIEIPQKFRIPILISILVTFITSFSAATFYFTVQPVIPLMYTLALPEQQLVDKQWLMIFPALSFAINFFNLLTLNIMKKYKKVLLQIFAWTTVLLQILLLIAMIRIIIIIS